MKCSYCSVVLRMCPSKLFGDRFMMWRTRRENNIRFSQQSELPRVGCKKIKCRFIKLVWVALGLDFGGVVLLTFFLFSSRNLFNMYGEKMQYEIPRRWWVACHSNTTSCERKLSTLYTSQVPLSVNSTAIT